MIRTILLEGGKQSMKHDELQALCCSVSDDTLSSQTVSETNDAVRSFSALRFYFFSFSFTPLPIRKKRLF